MNNITCPNDEILSEYLSGVIRDREKPHIEAHLAGCRRCRRLVSEAHEILSRPDPGEYVQKVYSCMIENIWFIAALASLLCSFIFRGRFMQFLVLSIILAAKWALKARTTKTLIMINEGRKDTEKNPADRVFRGMR